MVKISQNKDGEDLEFQKKKKNKQKRDTTYIQRMKMAKNFSKN